MSADPAVEAAAEALMTGTTVIAAPTPEEREHFRWIAQVAVDAARPIIEAEQALRPTVTAVDDGWVVGGFTASYVTSDVLAERDTANATLAKIRALHVRAERPGNAPWCDYCQWQDWPCETVRILDGDA